MYPLQRGIINIFPQHNIMLFHSTRLPTFVFFNILYHILCVSPISGPLQKQLSHTFEHKYIDTINYLP